MPLRDWFRPPRQLMLVFLAVALVSTGALGWLTWHLLAEDQASERQRRLDELDHAADTAVAAMGRDVAALDRLLDTARPSADPGSPGTMIVSLRAAGVSVSSGDTLLFYPVSPVAPPLVSDALLAAGRLELVREDLADAARAYDALSKSDNLALRATALTRLARVQRKRGAPAAALDAYDRLSRLPPATVDGYTAALVARVGRASVFDAAHDATKLRAEAGAFDDDLRAGRLAVTESQYRFYRSETARWLGSAGVPDDPDAVTRARAVGWLWQHQADLVAPQRRLVIFDTGTALILSKALPGADRLLAVVIGPSALQAMVRTAVPPGPRWALVDLEGRLAAGDAPPARQVVTRTSAATLLPWTLHLFPEPDAPDVFVSPRRTRLLSILATVAGVLVAGWFFIWRGISREIRAARLQSDFVAAVSHEFRSPLTSLRYIAELLAADRLPSEERRRQSYALLERETDRLTRLVEGLLEFGRFHAGAPALRFENIDLAELIPSLVSECRARAAPPNHVFECVTTATHPVIYGDRDAVIRSIWNLLDNAIKYSPRGGGIRVSLTDEEHPGWVAIVVSDEGMGIPGNEQSRVFDRFVRGAEATSRRIRGTGIGLAMVRQIARAHGGEITVASDVGVGSTFRLVLPVIAQHGQASKVAPQAASLEPQGPRTVT